MMKEDVSNVEKKVILLTNAQEHHQKVVQEEVQEEDHQNQGLLLAHREKEVENLIKHMGQSLNLLSLDLDREVNGFILADFKVLSIIFYNDELFYNNL